MKGNCLLFVFFTLFYCQIVTAIFINNNPLNAIDVSETVRVVQIALSEVCSVPTFVNNVIPANFVPRCTLCPRNGVAGIRMQCTNGGMTTSEVQFTCIINQCIAALTEAVRNSKK